MDWRAWEGVGAPGTWDQALCNTEKGSEIGPAFEKREGAGDRRGARMTAKGEFHAPCGGHGVHGGPKH